MIELFQKIHVSLPKPVDYIKKQQMLLTYIGGKWFMEKHKSKIPPFERQILIKEAHNKEYDIKKYI